MSGAMWKARVRLFFHCLVKRHCSWTCVDDKGAFYLACSTCSKEYWRRAEYIGKVEPWMVW